MTLAPLSATERRDRIAADIATRTGIDTAMIERLVTAFYDRAREDALLGPVFAARIADWDAHLARMCSFWASVALMSGTYHGNPMGRHLGLPIDARHFDRWLALFEETAAAVCPPAAAAHFIERARRIAQSLELGIASVRGVRLGRGQRFHREDLVPHAPGDQP
jgi:hemoglobin